MKEILNNFKTETISDNIILKKYVGNEESCKIPDYITEIGAWAFADCKSLTDITIPNSVTSIGWDAFYNCTKLTIYCSPNSYAETYAKENGIPYEFISNDRDDEESGEVMTKKYLIIYKIIREEDDYEYNSPISLDWMNIDDYFSNRIYQIEYITDYAQQDGYIVWQERELISGVKDEN